VVRLVRPSRLPPRRSLTVPRPRGRGRLSVFFVTLAGPAYRRTQPCQPVFYRGNHDGPSHGRAQECPVCRRTCARAAAPAIRLLAAQTRVCESRRGSRGRDLGERQGGANQARKLVGEGLGVLLRPSAPDRARHGRLPAAGPPRRGLQGLVLELAGRGRAAARRRLAVGGVRRRLPHATRPAAPACRLRRPRRGPVRRRQYPGLARRRRPGRPRRAALDLGRHHAAGDLAPLQLRPRRRAARGLPRRHQRPPLPRARRAVPALSPACSRRCRRTCRW
jgi:hypothetical protein